MDVYENSLSEQEIEAFTVDNPGYYKEKWNSYQGALFKGWNFVALFFFFEWAFYRKMYREALLTVLSVYTLTAVIYLIPLNLDLLGEFIGQAFRFFLSAFANGLYYRKALRTVDKAKGMDDKAKLKYLSEKGGTSAVSVLVCVLLEIIMMFLPVLIMSYLS